MPYLLDANVFIQAKRLHYGMDFCPAFWDWLWGHFKSAESIARPLRCGLARCTAIKPILLCREICPPNDE